MDINTIILNTLQDVTLATIPVIIGFIIKFISKKASAEQMKIIETVATNAVKFIEENFGDTLHGKQKLDAATQWMSQELAKLNIKINANELEGYALSSLRTLRDQFEDQWKKSEQPVEPPTPVAPQIDVKPILQAIPMEKIQEYVAANTNGVQQ